MNLYYRRLLHTLDNYGLRGTLARVLNRLRGQPHSGPQPVTDPTLHPFDLRHNTDTGGYLPGEILATGAGAADLYNTAYLGISPSTLTQAIAALPLDPIQFTFVDVGCGKGRAVLVATHQHFRKVLGVELSPTLAAIARANTAQHPNVTIDTANAATYQYPTAPLVLFFYHPFLAPLLKVVLENILKQIPPGHDLYLLFANPGYPKLFARLPRLVEQWTKDFPLSAEDAAADQNLVFERYTLWKAR